jgi:hypothetical protein
MGRPFFCGLTPDANDDRRAEIDAKPISATDPAPRIFCTTPPIALNWPYTLINEQSMDRQHILNILANSKPELAARFGITELALFGSTARGTATTSSDVDVLVAFDGPATSSRYFGVQFYLEDKLGRPVDLVTSKALRAELRPYIEQERVNV